jgi:hypothetical protein
MLPVIAGAVLCCLSLPVCSMTGSGMNDRIAAALALWWCIVSSDVKVVLVVSVGVAVVWLRGALQLPRSCR